MSDDEFLEGPLSSIVENDSGQPFHEWLITEDGTVDGWWGEGYVIRTIEPFLVFKWGFTTKRENQGMSGGFEFDNGQFLSVLLVSQSVDANPEVDIREYIPGAVLAAVQKAQLSNLEADPRRQLALALMCLEEEEGTEALKNVLAEGLAATCARLQGQSTSRIAVAQDFVKADITVNVKP